MTGTVLLVCRDPAGAAAESGWAQVVRTASDAITVVEVAIDPHPAGAVAALDELADPRLAGAALLVLGIGSAAYPAYRLAARLRTAFRLVVADAADPAVPQADAGTTGFGLPITAIGSGTVRAQSGPAIAAWGRRTTGSFEFRSVPSWRLHPTPFVLGALRHLHEAGLLAGPDDRGDALNLRP